MKSKQIQHMLLLGVLLALVIACIRLWNIQYGQSGLAQSQWRMQSINSSWQTGDSASVGLTSQALEFRLQFDQARQNDYLTVAPAYLDMVEVVYFDNNNQVIEQQIKGDKVNNSDYARHFDIGHLAFSVPPKSTTATVLIRTTENLQATVRVQSETELIFISHLTMILISGVLFIIAGVSIASAIAAWQTRQWLYAAFSAHQFIWLVLLLCLSAMVPSLLPVTSKLNDQLLGTLIIVATVTGTTFHWSLLNQLIISTWLPTALTASLAMSAFNIFTYLFGNQQVALQANSITLVCTMLALLYALLTCPRRNKRHGLVLKKIKWIYAFLLALVCLGALTRLGFSNGRFASFAYLFAFITMLLLGYILLIRNAIEQRHKTITLSKNHAIAAANNQLNSYIEEQTALLAMLSHEIKTPLTTLKLLIFGSPIREQLGYQLRSIENVIDTVALMDRLKSDFENHETFNLEQLVKQEWSKLELGEKKEQQLSLTCGPTTQLIHNRLATEVIVKNLLSNAVKYSSPKHIAVTITRDPSELFLQIKNPCKNLSPEDIPLLTNKYHRAQNIGGMRGTGLGLWITKTLCEANDIKLNLTLQNNHFVATLRLKL